MRHQHSNIDRRLVISILRISVNSNRRASNCLLVNTCKKVNDCDILCDIEKELPSKSEEPYMTSPKNEVKDQLGRREMRLPIDIQPHGDENMYKIKPSSD